MTILAINTIDFEVSNLNNEIIDKLYDLITGEDGFLVTLRCENSFPIDLYKQIIEIISSLVDTWKKGEVIPLKAFRAICYLMSETAGGSRFLDEKDAIMLEDANIELLGILSELE